MMEDLLLHHGGRKWRHDSSKHDKSRTSDFDDFSAVWNFRDLFEASETNQTGKLS
jgi:hypothetical protein